VPVRPSQVRLPATVSFGESEYIGEGTYLVAVDVQLNGGGLLHRVSTAVKAKEPLTQQEMFDAVLTQLKGE
jgi:hypothetical protein